MSKTINDWITELYSDDKAIRKEAVRALSYMGDTAVEPLIEEISRREDVPLQVFADVLAQIGGTGVNRMCDVLQAPLDEVIRVHAAQILGLIADTRAVLTLVMTLDDDNEAVRQAAVSALGQFSDPRATVRLIETLQHDTPKVRATAAITLGSYYRDGRVVNALLAAAQSPEVVVRAGAMRGLARFDDERVEATLQQGARDPDPEVRQIAAASLQLRSGDRMVFARGQKNVDSEVESVVDQILDDDTIDESDLQLMRNSNPRVRAALLDKIGDLGKKEKAVRLMIPGLNDINPAVRKTAVESILRVGTDAVPVLIEALQDKSKYIRSGSLEVLGIIKDERAIEPLIAATHDAEPMVRIQAIESLAQYEATDRIVQVMRGLRKDQEKDIRELAEQTLLKWGIEDNPVSRFFRRLTGN